MSAMTEEEARTKWCPFSRYAWNGGVTSNRGSANDQHPDFVYATRCLGSACMLWRSVAHNPQRRWRVEWRGETTTYFWDPSTHQEYADAKVEEMKPDVEPRGFCGLAGRPE